MWIIFLNLRKNEKNWDSFVIALLVSMVRLLKMTLFVLKALNWETNVGYTFNAIFPDNFQTWSTKVFSNIVQEDLNVYPEYVKLGIDFWKLFRYISSSNLKSNLTIWRPFLHTYIKHDSCPLRSTLLRFWLVSANVRVTTSTRTKCVVH